MGAVLAYASWLEAQGYKLKAEPYELEYPNTPVLKATRGAGEESFYEIASKVNRGRAEDWVRYGKASSTDTRFVVVVANGRNIATADLAHLKTLGVGVHLISGAEVTELCPAKDLSLPIEFPAVSGPLAKKLSTAKRLFADGHWREAYKEACLELEDAARRHLIKRVRSGATFASDKGTQVFYTEDKVSKLTLGQVEIAFQQLAGPTQVESRVTQAIARVRPNRNAVTHKPKSAKQAQQLREQVGKDLIVIVNAMRMLR